MAAVYINEVICINWVAVRAYAYARVSTEEQASSALGLDAQLASTHRAIADRGWELAGDVIDAGVSGAVPPESRDALGPLLGALDAGEADALVAARLDRLTRSTRGWLDLADRSLEGGWVLVSVAENFDFSTETGEFTMTMFAAVAQLERRLIGSRVREAMAAAKARGVRLGRPVEHSPAVRDLVVEMRESGATLQQIADRLTSDGVTTPRGGLWHPATVRVILRSHNLDIEASDARDRAESEALLAAESFEAA